jgi:hypothetical protein
MSAVVIDYNDLLSGLDLKDEIKAAFGRHEASLGLLTVKNVPGLQEARSRLLRQGFLLGRLAPEELAAYEHPASAYSFGWSHGKERLEGKLDLSKGSFYANPLFDSPSSDPDLIRRYVAY